MKKLILVLIVTSLYWLTLETSQAQPANDLFVNAYALAGNALTTNGNSNLATKEPGEPNHANFVGGRSVWFTWTAPTNVTTRIDTVGSGFNTLLGVYTGSAVEALTLVAANDNVGEGFGGQASRVEFPAVAGTTYRIAIDGRNFNGTGPASGNYLLNILTLASVYISSPTNGTILLSGTPLTIQASADIVPNPPVVRMDLFRNGVIFGTDSQAPYSYLIDNPLPGTNRFAVVALDTGGLSWTSAVVNVIVLSEGVTVVSPPDGATLLNTNPIPITVATLLTSGTITNVEFFVDEQKVGEDSGAPFESVWSAVTPGAHRFTATGRGDNGLVYQSLPIFIAVARTIVPTNSVWKYLDNGTDQSNAWYSLTFDDSGWTNGPAELGYGDGTDNPPRPEATVVSFGPDANNKYITTYFRHAFNATGVSGYSNLVFNVLRDDGAVVYLNGVEAARFNMPGGPVFYNTLANNAGDDGTIFFPATVPASFLVEGPNVLAVEIHQATLNSSDISFDMELIGVPVIPRNRPPITVLTDPDNNSFQLAPGSILLQATAMDPDPDGSVAKVEFFADGAKLGEDLTEPYEFEWFSPPIGVHTLAAVGTDNENASGSSSLVTVIVQDEIGTPLVSLTSPPNGFTVEGPTNLTLRATAVAVFEVTHVEFLADGVVIGNDFDSPYSATWNAPFGPHTLTAVAYDSFDTAGTSAPVAVTITIPPTNTVAPFVVSSIPAPGSIVSNLTTVQVTFSERVVGVDAADLRLNGVAATQVSGSVSNYTFTFVQPAYGDVAVTWAPGHGITDLGYPSSLPFDETAPSASWNYTLVDRVLPTVIGRVPQANAIVTNLTEVSVTFSEPVSGVEAADFLVNGVPALGMSGEGTNYVFTFGQPSAGAVAISWRTGHGIADLADAPNPFNATGAGATWNYTLDPRTIFLGTNSLWQFIKGTNNASDPIDAWRQLGFNDSGWSNALAPFYYGDPYNTPGNPGTLLSDMQNNYSSIYLRQYFLVPNPGLVTNLFIQAQIDDGFIAWINGVEVARVNMPAGEVAYNGVASATAQEPQNNGAAYVIYSLPNPAGYLFEGVNVVAVHAFNQSLTQSSDFGFNGQLYTYLVDPTVVAPRVLSASPPAGEVFNLTNVTIRFSEPVSGVSPGDLLVNGVAATGLTTTTNTTYTFSFGQPAFGTVTISWDPSHSIADFDDPPKPFNHTGPGASFQYSLVNLSAPTVALQSPAAGTAVTDLSAVTVTFSEHVAGVNATDLLVNGAPASGISGGPTVYTFTFPQPAYGLVTIGWNGDPGIHDLDVPANPFDPARPGNSWFYNFVDQTPPAILSRTPAAGTTVLNLTEVTVVFTEPVAGVDASDFLLNGTPAASVSGSGASYTFSFEQLNATVVNITWANTHGIRDLAPVPNAFDTAAPGATWSYVTPDNLAPSVASIDPPPGATVRSLNLLSVMFSEAVTGVHAEDLRINSRTATLVNGAGAGPYTFSFQPPSNGVVEVTWAGAHGITDLAMPPNAFGGGEWTYTLDPTAVFAEQVIINEIMFNPLSGRTAEEWIELYNVSAKLINLSGWRFTRGVGFTFPNVSIPAGGYLVVAADVTTFQARYPGVANVVGGWTGGLANGEETIELETVLGELVDSVHYATDGDWGRRERGLGPELVGSITRNGTTATITLLDHGYSNGDNVMISGADQPEYNGRFAVAGAAGNSTFNITVSGAPASPATGLIVCRQVLDDGQSGWAWSSAADGLGSSLELVNPALPNITGQNWLTSTNLHGTPGAPNSVSAANTAPLILEVTHAPKLPQTNEPVAVTARIRDELPGGVGATTLFFRNHANRFPPAFATTNLVDDGMHGDGVAGDGLYGALLPPATNGTIIEFYVQATDNTGRSRTWPAPAWETNNTYGQFANAMYRVDQEVISSTMPSIRLVMTATERALFPPGNRNGNAQMNVTMIATDGGGTEVRYLGGVRVRGAGSRTRTPPNNRLSIPNDAPWNGRTSFNLNGQFVHAQLAGSALARKAGLPASDAKVFQYRINGVNPAPQTAPVNGSGNGAGYGTFILLEPVNGDLAADLFPEDGDGNVYRASTGQHNADLTYQGANPAGYLARGYFKTSNRTENDWTDLMNLTTAFSQVPNNQDYLRAISTNVNVTLWLRYFSIGTLLNFGETSLFNGRGDDYALYRGQVDRRFVVLGHDFDTILGQGDTVNSTYNTMTNSSIFIMLNPPNTGGFQAPNVPVLQRFLTNEVIVPLFFAELKRLADTTFHPSQLNPLLDQVLNGWGNGPTITTIQAMKDHAANRRAVILSQIPLQLTANHALSPSNGFLYTTTPVVPLSGVSHAIDTRRVLVNGAQASWSAWETRWTHNASLFPGINPIVIQSLDSNNVEFARLTLDVWYDDGSLQNVSGTIATDAAWTAAAGPYMVTANLTVANGATLTIQPGTSVYLGPGVDITVANGGRLLAEGTDTARIRFGPAPGGAAWGGITVNGAAGSPETRIAYAHFDGNNDTAIHSDGGTVFLDHLSFGNPGRQYVSLDASSFVVQYCVFPTATNQFELVHGDAGIKAGGRGLFLRNFFGKSLGFNDTVDFSGGNRPGPIVQFLHNVFNGTDDDLLDLDGTDAWIEGNVFLHVHRNNSPDSASAISGGSGGGQTSQITIIGNLIYDVDQAINAKEGNFYTLLNNTIVHQTKIGSQDTNTAVVILADDGTAQGAGVYLEGNIILDAENLTRNVTTAVVTYTNNIIAQLTGAPWTGLGGGNLNADPLLKYIPPFSETSNYTSWAQAQVMWDHFSLKPGSPATGAGPNGLDLGGVIPTGVSLSGVPVGSTPETSATIGVGINRTGNAIPTAGFPNGSGYTHYRYRLDGGVWSPETALTVPIQLNGLAVGPHTLEVVGLRDAGFYQNDPIYGASAVVTLSRTWTVHPNASPVRIHEILASNNGSLSHEGTTPDAIELYNSSPASFDLSGVSLSDDAENPAKFLFPPNTSIGAREYLTVYANNPDGTSGFHLGFNLAQEGGTLYLYNSTANGGALLDSVQFGLQLTDLSIGRLADGTWSLTSPTFGARNVAAATGDPRALRINEWLAIAQVPFDSDFLELYNPGTLPVALGGLYLSDEIVGFPNRHPITPLSFMAGQSYRRFFADGSPELGAEHLNFALSGQQGEIGLFLPNLKAIDCVYYQPQRPNISQGRSPNGSETIVFFDTPTPGSPNPLITTTPAGDALVINEVLASNASLVEGGRTPDWVELYNGTTNTLDLGGMTLSDDSDTPDRFVFAPETMMIPGAFLRVLCDGGQPAGPNNAAFGLSAAGGTVYLYQAAADGGALLSAITYGLQTADLSIGRVPDGSLNWMLNAPTPNAPNTPILTLGSSGNLRVNEWLADPPQGEDDWLEIYNGDSLPVALGGLYLSDNLNDRSKHRIADLSFLGTGTNAWQRFVADGNTGAGADHVGFSLRAADEDVALSSTNGTLIDGYDFSQMDPNVSEGRFPDGAATVIRFPGTASPGASNFRWLAEVAINEVLTHTDLPFEDAIELRNMTGSPIEIGGWWLSDDKGTLQKYQIPIPTTLPANSFVVIYESGFTNRDLAAIPFALSSHGDEVVLSSVSGNALTGYRTYVDFGAQDNGVSFGTYRTSDNRMEFVSMSAKSLGVDDPGSVEEFRQGLGKTNAYPHVGPVVITEIMYHPPDVGGLDNVADEFIELRNITAAPVMLFDPAAPTNVWHLRDAVDFNFPSNTIVDAGAHLLVVSFDPINNPGAAAAFRARYQLSTSVKLVGPYQGRLANDSEDIELRKPGEPDAQGVDYVLVERVRYFDGAPWPTAADGSGDSLQRVFNSDFGNDPSNWVATTPIPGAPTQDLDGDRLPDDWENLYGFNPLDPNDPGYDADFDGDGQTNGQEYQAGTDPTSSSSLLQIDSVQAVQVPSPAIVLVFQAVANKSYTVERASSVTDTAWTRVQDIAAAPNPRSIQITDPIEPGAPQRFYRVRTPIRP